MSARTGHLIHTVKYLKAAQLMAQLHHRARPIWERPQSFPRTVAGELGECVWKSEVDFLAPGAPTNRSGELVAGRYSFLNRTEGLGWPPRDWDAVTLPKLWQYNLHYFEWLWALEFEDACAAIVDWIERHPLDKGRVGWEPYPISLRIMNWCGVCFGRYRDQTEADASFARQLRHSLAVQTEWLLKHLETHLLGNHLLENGAALAFVGSAFEGRTAARWFNAGVSILGRELAEQILPDGMHFERSPMYHTRITYLAQLLYDTGTLALRELIEPYLPRLRHALAQVCHPDGHIALFNDSAFGVYNHPQSLLSDFAQPACGPWALPDAGYYGYCSGDGCYVICDAGPIGPDYIPGHAHGDMFSFELSIRGQRVVVDTGVYDYEVSERRKHCRSTQAHNTVEIAGEDQCEFWGAFRVARRGYPRDVQWEPNEDGFVLSGWHDGYRRLKGSPIHSRTVSFNVGTGLSVRDRIQSSRTISSISRLHLAPDCRITLRSNREARIDTPAGAVEVEFVGQGVLRLEQSVYFPEFGVEQGNHVLTFTFKGTDIETGFTLEWQ